MLAPAVVQRIRQLLAEGQLSQRMIARTTGVSRGTVATIALGRRPDYEAMRRQRQAEREQPDGPLQRCPTCGGQVIMPCRRCRLEEMIRAGRVPRLPRRPEEDLQLQLVGAHRERYERLHALRLAGQVEEESL